MSATRCSSPYQVVRTVGHAPKPSSCDALLVQGLRSDSEDTRATTLRRRSGLVMLRSWSWARRRRSWA
eukprot:3226827-Heterocapsa_arctica.AAC.1